MLQQQIKLQIIEYDKFYTHTHTHTHTYQSQVSLGT